MASAKPAMAENGAGVRLDKFLWFSRLMPSRADAAKLCESRHLRLDGRVIDKAHATVRVGSVISFPKHGDVRIVRVMQLPVRRGPASVAALTYQDLSSPKKPAISSDQRGSKSAYAEYADA
jgi:ribosome-associated heat shock protein Hsp15